MDFPTGVFTCFSLLEAAISKCYVCLSHGSMVWMSTNIVRGCSKRDCIHMPRSWLNG